MKMKLKLTIAAGMLAMVGAAYADCTSVVNGVYVGVRFGVGVTTAKGKIKTKAGTISGKSGEKWKDATEDAKRKAIDQNATQVWGKEVSADWKDTKSIRPPEGAEDGYVELKDVKDENTKKVIEAFMKEMTTLAAFLKENNIVVKNENDKEVKLDDKATYTVMYDPDNEMGYLSFKQENSGLTLYNGEERVAFMETGRVQYDENGDEFFNDDPGYLVAAPNPNVKDEALLNQQTVARVVRKFMGPVLAYKTWTSKEGAGTETEKIEARDREIKSHKNNMNVGLSLGYQAGFGGFGYAGVEGDVSFTPGKVKVQTPSVVKTKTHYLGNYKFDYASEVSSGLPEISLKQKYSFGVTILGGITSGNWAFYIPVTGRISKYDLKIIPPSVDANLAAPTVTYLGKEGYSALKLTDVTVTEDGVTTTDASKSKQEASYKKVKTKFVVEAGLGARVFLSPTVFLDLRFTTSLGGTSIKVDIPANMSSNALHDVNRLGTEYKVKVKEQKGSLGVGLRF
jgi:hypothetical protein